VAWPGPQEVTGTSMGADVIRDFVEPMPDPPRKRPLPRRRFAFSLLFPGAVTAAGGLLFIIHACLSDRPHPVPKPGPRRYPPAYRRAAQPKPPPRSGGDDAHG
jgi:hypothetical protein